MDVTIAAAALLALSPVLLTAMIVVRLSIGSPVFFRQDRPGLDGANFRILKLRTMTDARDASGALLPDTDRLTRVGSFLRSTSVDELPELWNVIRGDMSLVGPRPLLHHYTPHLSTRERERLRVRPGITGWAQVHGRNELSWDARLAHDVWYVENWRLSLDLRILTQTCARVLKRDGIAVDPGAVMLNLDVERANRQATDG